MCDPGQSAGPSAALAAVAAGLAELARLDMTTLTTDEQAEVLRTVGRAEAQGLAARSAVLAAFDASGGFEADGMAGSRSWLRCKPGSPPRRRSQRSAGCAGFALIPRSRRRWPAG